MTPSSPSLPQDAPDDRPIVGWLWQRYLKKRWVWIAVAVTFMAIEGSMLGALSYIVQPMFDDVFVAGDKDAIGWVAAAVAAIFVIRAVAAFCHRVIMQAVGQHVSAQMQREMVGHLITLDSAYFQTTPPGTLIERVRGDTLVASTIWATVLAAAGRDVVSLIALFTVAISVDWLWTLIAVAGAPLLIGPVLFFQRFVRRTTARARGAAGVLSTRLDEIFHGMNTIKLNTAEARERGRFETAIRSFLRLEVQSRAGQAAIPALTDFVAALGFFGVLTFGGLQIIEGDKTVGEFMSFFTAMGLLFEPLRRVANISGVWQAARASFERIRSIFDIEPSITSPAKPAVAPEKPEDADVVLDDVVVRYGDEPALDGLTLTAKAGQMTALVGTSGAGKSTVFNTLTRLVDPTTGEVRIGGVPARDMALPDLRSLFAVVTQDAPMFDESLRDNIVLSLEGVTEEALNEAIEAAALTEFIASLPQGLDTLAGPRGSNLSGGQRQRVAIARALLRNAPILLLDEATSALDAESEIRVQTALERLSATRTTLVIAHRLSTIRAADQIAVMDKGRLVDSGTHEDLMAKEGLYSKLHGLQFQGAS